MITVLIILILIQGVDVVYPYRKIFDHPNHSGEYLKSNRWDILPIIEPIKKVIGPNRILVSRDTENEEYGIFVSSGGLAQKIAMYFFSENAVGGTYKIGAEDYEDWIANTIKPDYILVVEPGEYLKDLFSLPVNEDGFFLVQIDHLYPLESTVIQYHNALYP